MLFLLLVGTAILNACLTKDISKTLTIVETLKGYKPLTIEQLRAVMIGTKPSIVLFHSYRGKPSGPTYKSCAEIPKHMKGYLPKVALYTFDCFPKPLACADQGIQRYPTMMLFANKNKYVFNPPYNHDALKEWLDNLLFVIASEVTTKRSLQKLLDRESLKNNKLVKQLPIFFFCGSPSHAQFRPFDKLSKSRYEKENYYYVSNSELYPSLNCTLGDTLYLAPFSSTVVKNTNLSNRPYSLLRFLLSNKYPRVHLLNYFTYRDFFGEQRPMVIYFGPQDLTETSRSHEKTLKRLQALSEQLPNVELYYLFGKGERPHGAGSLGRKLTRMLDIDAENLPAVRVVIVRSDGPKNYKMLGEVRIDNIASWVQEILEGKVQPFLRSQQPKKHRKHFLVVYFLAETCRQELQVIHRGSEFHELCVPIQELC